MKKAVIGVFSTLAAAEAATNQLLVEGFSTADVSVLFRDERATREFAHEKHTKAPEGAATGAGAGGAIGGTLGLLAGIGALAIPGVGPFIAAGPIMAALSGAAAGAAAGGLMGSLVGFGIPEYEAKVYEGKVREGGILLSVHTERDDERKRAIDIFKKVGSIDVATKTQAGVPKKARSKNA
jgi:hypothetical protein